MHEELNNFTHNEVWTLEEWPKGARVIETKWVFRNKQDDQDDVQVINPPSSSNVPQDGDKDGRVENEDTHVSHEQMVTQAHDVDTPQPPPQVVDRRNIPLL